MAYGCVGADEAVKKEREDVKMNKNRKEYLTQKVTELTKAPTCCAEAKEAAQGWLDAVGTDKEAEKAKFLIAELEQDIVTAEGLFAFAASEAGEKVFGKEQAKQIAAHAKDLTASGIKYCDCPACAAVEWILDNKDGFEL